MGANDQVPAAVVDVDDKPRLKRILCVGGSLHGCVVEVPAEAPTMYVDHGISTEVVRPDGFEASDHVTLRATQRFELYVGRRLQGNLLVLAWSALSSDQVEREGVEALRMAAGL